ncbi:MAG TPA: hypothetical protein VKP64_09120 [Mycobacteriales bacterium]|nr:hypothetical protein [Mycobacteriales bacterium]
MARLARATLLSLAGTAALVVGLVATTATDPAADRGSDTAADRRPRTAAPRACAAPVASTTQPGYAIADPRCDVRTGAPFGPLEDGNGSAISTTYTGIAAGSAYRIEVPKRWNHELVLFAHGYRGTGTTVWVDSPGLRRHYIRRGFAWAASSYQTNGYDVGHGVRDTHALIGLFRTVTTRRPTGVYLTGQSMGGQVTVVALERYPRTFLAAMPYCGVLAETSLFSYFLDANVTAAALTGTPIRYPRSREAGAAYVGPYETQVLAQLPKLGVSRQSPVPSTAAGRAWQAAIEQRSGGKRPGFDSAMSYWNSGSFPPLTRVPFLFGLYPGLTGGTAGIAPGNVATNTSTVYQLDERPGLTPAEKALNARVLRVAATATASNDLTGIPAARGTPGVPVVSVHSIGDLFVPFSMEQIYARRVAGHGQSRLFVSRAIRSNAHCGFTGPELRSAFDDLVTWVRTGRRAAGDHVTNAAAVASATFGCRFTDGSHPEFRGERCRSRGD